MNIENRNDCSEFEAKQHKNDCGYCQTDGHYLCIGCKNIASFEDMEYHDNKMTFYYKEVVHTVLGEFLNQLFTMNDQPKQTHGGKRPNSGRPKKPKTKIVSFRVLTEYVEPIKELVKDFITNKSKEHNGSK